MFLTIYALSTCKGVFVRGGDLGGGVYLGQRGVHDARSPGGGANTLRFE